MKFPENRTLTKISEFTVVGLQCVIVVFPNYTHLLFVMLKIYFFISQSKHILCSHKRTVSINKLFEHQNKC